MQVCTCLAFAVLLLAARCDYFVRWRTFGIAILICNRDSYMFSQSFSLLSPIILLAIIYCLLPHNTLYKYGYVYSVVCTGQTPLTRAWGTSGSIDHPIGLKSLIREPSTGHTTVIGLS